MRYLVVIGDLVDSRAAADRAGLQQRLNGALAKRNGASTGIASPYTLTLGDEFQAVLVAGSRALGDAVAIQAAVHPTLVRFSLAVGELSTAVNRRQALGMDGPAFHRARDGIDTLKAEGALFHVSGLPPDSGDLANASLRLVSRSMGKWQTRRLKVLAGLQSLMPVADIARQLRITEQAVYKNVQDGGLREVLAAFDAIGRLLDGALKEDACSA